MKLDLYQLKSFFEVAKTQNYSQAAKKLHVTQSAISHAIKKLSRNINSPLFIKKGHRLQLSPKGKVLYSTCEKIFHELALVEELLKHLDGEDIGVIRLGATVEFGTTLLLKYMKDFINRNRKIHIDYQFRHELLKPLMNDDLDIIIDCKKHEHPDLIKKPLFLEHYVVIASKNYIKENKISKPNDLSKCKILSQDKLGFWWIKFINALPAKNRPDLKNVTEVNHVRGMINASMEGLGVGLVPKYCVTRELDEGKLVNVFPNVKIQEDEFCIYLKKSRSNYSRHIQLIDYLTGLNPSEFNMVRHE